MFYKFDVLMQYVSSEMSSMRTQWKTFRHQHQSQKRSFLTQREQETRTKWSDALSKKAEVFYILYFRSCYCVVCHIYLS